MNDGFGRFHPLLLFMYFAGAVSFLFLFPHPWFILTSIAIVFGLHGVQRSLSGKAKLVLLYGWMSLVVLMINPFLSSRGQHPIVELWWGQVLTWEATWYGVIAACTLFAMLMWLLSAQYVLRIHHLLYLCRRISPRGALLCAMALRSFHLLALRFQQLSIIHQHPQERSRMAQLGWQWRQALSYVQTTLSWTLEEGMHVADSMKARGYGSSVRTQYRPYVWSRPDRLLTVMMVVLVVCISIGWYHGFGQFELEPSVSVRSFTSADWSMYSCLTMYWLLPVLVSGWEKWRWRISSS